MTPCPAARCTPWHRLAALAAAVPLAWAGLAAPATAAVMISQVYGGGGNSGAPYTHDYVELHNSGALAVSLAGWSLQYASAAGSSWSSSTALAGSIPAGGYFLVRQAAPTTPAGVARPVPPDVTGRTNQGAANGKLALVNNGALLTGTCPIPGASVVDFVGYGTANCFEMAAAPGLGNSTALLRASVGSSCVDSGNNSSDFTSTATPLPRNSTALPQPCSGTGGGGGTPVAATIPAIQGSGATSPMVGQRVVTSGAVTQVNNNGFFMQDVAGDNNPATSDGIFVFTGATAYPAAAVGHLVQVTGTVVEFNTGASADTAAHTVTQLSQVTAVGFVNSGASVAPTVVALPEASNDDLERVEGMLVTLTGPLTVNQNFFQGRYGQLTLAVGGRLETPTNRHRPGTPQAVALADENARRRILLDDGSSLQNPNPIPYLGANGLGRAGDSTGSITGVIDYGLATNSTAGAGDYKIHPTVPPVFSVANGRTAAPAAVGGNLKVASFNVLNYFTTFTDGNTASGQTGQGCTLGGPVGGSTLASNCRGASNLIEFGRQQAKIVEAMAAIDADVLGLMEIQNNGLTAVQNLADALNARVGAGSYASTALPAQGTGTDAIRVAIIFKPAKLSPAGAAVSDVDPVNNRPTLAQTFSLANGERFTLLVNHLKSKGGCPALGDPDFTGNNDVGDGQGCWNAQRTRQATRLRSFVAERQTAAGSTDALLIGDFNAYAQEDPIYHLTSSGYIDQVGRFSPFGYSYVFDGAAGRLDHAIASATLSARVNRVLHWHINADEPAIADYNLEFKAPALRCGAGGTSLCPPDPSTASPYRSSDHDPVVVGLNLYKTITGNGRGALLGTPGDDLLIGGPGAQTMTGGAGNNVYVYQSMRDAGDTITDFGPGKDRIDLAGLLASIGTAPANALSRGVVKLVAAGAHTLLQIDTDGSAGPGAARTLATLLNVSPAQIVADRDLGVQ